MFTFIENFNEHTTHIIMPIKDWSEDDRPREKLINHGAESCSTAELLAILMTNGTRTRSAVELGEEVLKNCENNLVMFVRSTMEAYQDVVGIGPAKACIIKAAAELGRRIHMASLGEVIKINSPETAYEVMQFLRFKGSEEFWALFTNNSGMLIQKTQVGTGNGRTVPVDFRKLASQAISCNATRVILCHNHPGGSRVPSKEDISLTQDIKKMMKHIDVDVVEHIIITGDSYFSFTDEGLI